MKDNINTTNNNNNKQYIRYRIIYNGEYMQESLERNK